MKARRITIVSRRYGRSTATLVTDDEGRRFLADARVPLAVAMAVEAAIRAGAHLKLWRDVHGDGSSTYEIVVHSAHRSMRDALGGVGFNRRRNQYRLYEYVPAGRSP